MMCIILSNNHKFDNLDILIRLLGWAISRLFSKQLLIIDQIIYHPPHHMTSISWNDLNDSSELSDASSDEPPRKPVEEKSKNVPVTTLQKTVSSPAHQFRYGKSDNQKIAQNLQKLQKHESSRVWLYVPELPDDKQLDCNKILKDLPGVEEVSIFSRGANVWVKYQFAADLIQRGHSEKGYSFKFLYSHKNDNRDRQDGNKKGLHKKYSEKYQQPKQDNHYEPKQIKKKESHNSEKYHNDNNKDRYEEKTQKKKVKYVAKDSTSSKIQEEPLKSLQSTPQKSSEPSHPSELTQSIKQSETTESKSQVRDKIIVKAEKQQKKQNSVHSSDREDKLKKKESELSQDNKVEKKKPKKHKKKNKDREDNFHDPNNPFSFAS